MPTPTPDPHDADELAAILAAVRELHPDATDVLFGVLHDDRGYRVADVVLRGARSLAVVDPDALDELGGLVGARAAALACDGVLGSPRYGCSLIPADWRAPALV
jgi:hypothetical protein